MATTGVDRVRQTFAWACLLASMCWLPVGPAAQAQASDLGGLPAAPPTIDRITFTGSDQSYRPSLGLDLLGLVASLGMLSDGTTLNTGMTERGRAATLAGVEVVGATIRYHLNPPDEGVLHSVMGVRTIGNSFAGTLTVAGPLVLEASLGSTTAVLRGLATLVTNQPPLDSDVFNLNFLYYTSPPGAQVPFEITYQKLSGSWQPDSLDTDFSHRRIGSIDFAAARSIPAPIELRIVGAARIPSERDVFFAARVSYPNGGYQLLRAQADWSVTSDVAASAEAGLVRTGPLSTPEGELRMRVEYEALGASLSAEKTVRVARMQDLDSETGRWSTTGGNPRHSGYVPIRLEPQNWQVRWEQTVGSSERSTVQIAAADGRVFVSGWPGSDNPQLYALDAADGSTLWSKSFGRPRSVDAPAAAYGNVYLQTERVQPPGSSALYALDAETGDVVFEARARHSGGAFAPTVFDGSVYMGAYYYEGGATSFDAFSGAELWRVGLPDKWHWTPAVDENYAYVCVDGWRRVLRVLDRHTGELAFAVPGLQPDNNRGAIHGAPVIGDSNNVLATDRNALLSFDVESRVLSWFLEDGFVGQPVVRGDTIYVIRGGVLLALDASNGAEIRRWSPGNGVPLWPDFLVTDSHVFVSSNSSNGTVYALERDSFEEVWSYPRAAKLAFADETLYLIGFDNVITAISMPEFVPATLTALEIVGPSEIRELSEVRLVARAHYSDGSDYDRSVDSEWSIEPTDAARIDESGLVSVGTLRLPELPIVVRARYSEAGVTAEGQLAVTLKIGISVQDLVRRNLSTAKTIREGLREGFGEAADLENAARSVLEGLRRGDRNGSPSRSGAGRVLDRLRKAIFFGQFSAAWNENSIEQLEDSLEELERPDAPDRPRRAWWHSWQR